LLTFVEPQRRKESILPEVPDLREGLLPKLRWFLAVSAPVDLEQTRAGLHSFGNVSINVSADILPWYQQLEYLSAFLVWSWRRSLS